jgi:cytochrome c-type biogenesis protein CcmH
VTWFLVLAVLATTAAAAVVLWPLLRDPADRSAIAAVTTALLLPACVLFGYLAASNYDWARPPAAAPTGSAVDGGGGQPLEAAVAALEQRLAAQADDPAGWLLLGSSYTALGRPDDALAAYRQADQRTPGGSLDARLGIAEAELLKDRAGLAGKPGDSIEAVLAAAPGNPKALWYGGLVALARNQPALAATRWQALLALDPPPRIRSIVESELAALDAGPAPPASAQSAAVGINVAVTLDPALAPRVRAGAPLFVFVRDAAGGPPLAVLRRAAGELPLKVEITSQDVMIPGRSLAGIRQATVTARVANGGDPVARPGDLFGEASWAPGDGPVAIVINEVVPGG